MDAAHKATDKRLLQLEKKLKREYETAAREIGKEWLDYMDDVSRRLENLQDRMTQATFEERRVLEKQYQQIVSDATVRNARFQAVSDHLAAQISNVNEISAAYINGTLPEIYALNSNFIARQTAGKVAGISFDIVDAQTIKNLATKDSDLLPTVSVDRLKDIRWNKQQINSQVMQGILKGESVPKIAKRFANVIAMNEASAERNARTAVTSAENGGRIDRMRSMEEMGIIIEKEWISATDKRVREEHLALNGVTLPLDEPFVNGYGEIDRPGDPNSDPANVYNCRCTLGTKIIDFKKV